MKKPRPSIEGRGQKTFIFRAFLDFNRYGSVVKELSVEVAVFPAASLETAM